MPALEPSSLRMVNQVADHSMLVLGDVVAETTSELDALGRFWWEGPSVTYRHKDKVACIQTRKKKKTMISHKQIRSLFQESLSADTDVSDVSRSAELLNVQ